MTATTETVKTLTVDGGPGVDADVLLDFLADVPAHAAVSMRPGSSPMDPARTILTARWSAKKQPTRRAKGF